MFVLWTSHCFLTTSGSNMVVSVSQKNGNGFDVFFYYRHHTHSFQFPYTVYGSHQPSSCTSINLLFDYGLDLFSGCSNLIILLPTSSLSSVERCSPKSGCSTGINWRQLIRKALHKRQVTSEYSKVYSEYSSSKKRC